MEKLQPLITHRFWVLFGLAILVPLVSWWLYNSDMVKTIDERTSTLNSEFETAGRGRNAPNQNWVAAASATNELNRKSYNQAADSGIQTISTGTNQACS